MYEVHLQARLGLGLTHHNPNRMLFQSEPGGQEERLSIARLDIRDSIAPSVPRNLSPQKSIPPFI